MRGEAEPVGQAPKWVIAGVSVTNALSFAVMVFGMGDPVVDPGEDHPGPDDCGGERCGAKACR
jgi:hypothetical protein